MPTPIPTTHPFPPLPTLPSTDPADWLAPLRAWRTAVENALDNNLDKTPIAELIQIRSLAMDWLIGRVGELFFGDNDPSQKIVLFAIGGYGRFELSPHSDTDLLIVCPPDYKNDEISNFIAYLWDLGVNPACTTHPLTATHTPTDPSLLADISHATALLDARLIFGDDQWANLPYAWLTQHWDYASFYTAKIQEKTDRQHRHQHTVQHLEPNLKTGVGGLRAIQLVGWLWRAKRLFAMPANAKPDLPVQPLSDLLNNAPLPAHWQTALQDGLLLFLRLRHELHRQTHKGEERLLFAHQRTIAERLGYPNDPTAQNPNFAPECLMRAYFLTASQTHRIAESVYRQWRPDTDLPSTNQTPIDGTPFVIIDESKTLSLANLALAKQAFLDNPSDLLFAFVLMARHNLLCLEPTTADALAVACERIDDAYRQNPTHQAWFVEILNNPHQLANLLNLMAQHGILGRYLPEFGQIMGLMQYDLFHRYTVDDHTLRLLAILGQMGGQTTIPKSLYDHSLSTKRHFAKLCDLYQSLDNPALLSISALFHDIAKGQTGDHSVNGANIARAFCCSHQFSQDDSELIVWLVAEHLTMSHIAQKKDIYDPAVLLSFAKLVGSVRRLTYLYLLTVADMNATNHQLWNDWRATLLANLYDNVLPLLQNNHTTSDHILHERKAQAWQKSGLSSPVLSQFWQAFDDDYFAKNSADTLAWHATCVLKANQSLAHRPHPDTGLNAHELMIFAPNQTGLFLAIVLCLDKHQYSVLQASITTSETGKALDNFVILSRPSPTAQNLEQLNRLMDDLAKLLDDSPKLGATKNLNPSPMPTTHNLMPIAKNTPNGTHFQITPSIRLKRHDRHSHSLTIACKDRPRLLIDIAEVLLSAGILVQRANIVTLGVRAEDHFIIAPQTPMDDDAWASLWAGVQKRLLMVVSSPQITYNKGFT